MSQHALDLGMLQELISSPPCHQIHACQNELCNHSCLTILCIETDQRHFWWESKVLQGGGDGRPPGTRRTYQAFARCTACGKVYWRGAHSRRLEDIVASAIRAAATS